MTDAAASPRHFEKFVRRMAGKMPVQSILDQIKASQSSDQVSRQDCFQAHASTFPAGGGKWSDTNRQVPSFGKQDREGGSSSRRRAGRRNGWDGRRRGDALAPVIQSLKFVTCQALPRPRRSRPSRDPFRPAVHAPSAEQRGQVDADQDHDRYLSGPGDLCPATSQIGSAAGRNATASRQSTKALLFLTA
jgi:hypothetical protein